MGCFSSLLSTVSVGLVIDGLVWVWCGVSAISAVMPIWIPYRKECDFLVSCLSLSVFGGSSSGFPLSLCSSSRSVVILWVLVWGHGVVPMFTEDGLTLGVALKLIEVWFIGWLLVSLGSC